SLTMRAAGGQGVETLVDDVSVAGAELAGADQSQHRLLYATPELLQPLHLSGRGTVQLTVASSEPADNLSVWLIELPWDDGRNGTTSVITRGWADPQNYRSQTESEPLVPGRFYQLTFELQPDDQIVPAGRRIGLMVFSSDQDFTLW